MKPWAASILPGVVALLGLAACAADPRMGIYVDPAGQVHPSVTTTVGGLRIGANGTGGHVGTSVGPIDLGLGF